MTLSWTATLLSREFSHHAAKAQLLRDLYRDAVANGAPALNSLG